MVHREGWKPSPTVSSAFFRRGDSRIARHAGAEHAGNGLRLNKGMIAGGNHTTTYTQAGPYNMFR